ncbi:MAG: PTS sugar transporter subunit IIA [Acidiferrobacteraceae bacterium]
MIGILILAQKDIGAGLVRAVEHVLGTRPPSIAAFPVNYDQPPEQLAAAIARQVAHLDTGDGVLILADIYGATHINVACRILKRGRVELVAGVNLPMVIRVLNYRNLDMPELVDKAIKGGAEGILCATDSCVAEARRP